MHVDNLNGMFVDVILGSENEKGSRIFTVHCHYPRFIHSEVMSHRAFSRNARSSRAVPVKNIIEEIKNNPVVPWHWHKNCKGMEGYQEHDALINGLSSKDMWINASRKAVEYAELFNEAKYHKQIVNRILEPFMWIDTLITSTEKGLDNFFSLRKHHNAEPHMQDLANLMYDEINNYVPKLLLENGWHLPYINESEFDYIEKETLCRISSARCARISYNPFNKTEPDIIDDLRLFNKLVSSIPIHASPLEHQARANVKISRSANLRNGWTQFRRIYEKSIK